MAKGMICGCGSGGADDSLLFFFLLLILLFCKPGIAGCDRIEKDTCC